MELSDFNTLEAVEKGFTYTVLTPFGENKGKPTDFKIDVVGIGCKSYEDASSTVEAYLTKCQAKGKPIDKDHLHKLNLNLLVACTRGWEGVTEDGKKVVFSKENAYAFYDKYPWLASQVIDAMADIDSMLEKK